MELAWAAAVLLLCVAAAGYALWPLPRVLQSAVLPDAGDPLLVSYILGWDAHTLLRSPWSVFDANVMYPAADALAFTENFLGVAALVAPIFWATGNAALTYNTALLACFAMGGLGTYLALRQLDVRRPAAVVGGLAFTLMPYRLQQAMHLHVVAVHLLPFALLAAFRLARRPSWRRAALLGGITALQLWSSLTAGFLTLVALACWAAAVLIAAPRRSGRTLTFAAGAVACAVASVAPALVKYVTVRAAHPESRLNPAHVLLFSATPRSYLASLAHPDDVLSTLYAPLARHAAATGSPWETSLFPGLWGTGALLLTFAVLAARGRRPSGPTLLFVLLMGVAGLLSLGPRLGATPDGLALPSALLFEKVQLLRVPGRFGLLTQAGLVFLGALSIDGLRRDRARVVLVAVSIVTLLADAAPTRFQVVEAPLVEPAHELLRHGSGPVLALPALQLVGNGEFYPDTAVRDGVHMYLSTAHFRPLVNGYAQFVPATYQALAARLPTFPSDDALHALRELDVRTVVVQTNLLPGTPWEGVVTKLETRPDIALVASGRTVRVYELRDD